MKEKPKPTYTDPVEEDGPLLELEIPEDLPIHNDPQPQKSSDDDDDDDMENMSAQDRLIKSFTEDEEEGRTDFNISYILRGDVLTAKWLRRQIPWFIMLVLFAFLYVSNRYYAQKQMIHNNQLRHQLKEIHYDAMARSSELMRNCRRSTILDRLNNNPNNTILPPDKQPAVITPD